VKKLQTLIDECEAHSRNVCVLIDNNATPENIAKARADRDAKLAAIHARPDGRNYDRGYN
jgi:hypothetical protein